MPYTTLPTEVELAFEVMPCNALRVAQEPGKIPHSCAYFRQWGTYHSFDYVLDGPPATPGIPTKVKYVGRAPLLPEPLSGCRKAAILGVGINPNLPGWQSSKRGALNPLFDDYRQYAHYFRYRAVDKLIVSGPDYLKAGGGAHDTPFSDFVLNIPPDANGDRLVNASLDPQSFYVAYQGLLDDLAKEMKWDKAHLQVGEDLAYMNMVACPSARWLTKKDDKDPALPPMTPAQKTGIVNECFRKRRYFKRQLLQSLPSVLLVISQNTTDAFLEEMQGNFSRGNPQPKERVLDLLERDVRLRYGTLPDGSTLEAKVIFSPHITGNPAEFAAARKKVMAQLVSAAQAGFLKLNNVSGHFVRPRGACLFCPMLEIGKCDYEKELQPLSLQGALTAATVTTAAVVQEKAVQMDLLDQMPSPAAEPVWDTEGDTNSGL